MPAQTAAYMTTQHPDYAVLAARIAISNLHKETKKTFSHVIRDLYEYGQYTGSRIHFYRSQHPPPLQSTQRTTSPRP